MKIVHILLNIVVIYIFYWTGVKLQQILNLFIPGSVIGMIFCFLFLHFNIIKPSWVEAGARLLISYMPLLFIPVTAGIINYLGFFAGKGMVLIAIIVISTVLVMISSGHIVQYIMHRKETNND
ncbi:CidA/LrgA family protein [Aquibacillus sediminis]|uniref:CidA/LrgA family protein n=1 Tax=Aquibacillus sediminis TaxID=2574734 RepID=UPI001FE7B4C2|nr:CidA/LrgA family holin-like protein [Aquibacillus sediminis]